MLHCFSSLAKASRACTLEYSHLPWTLFILTRTHTDCIHSSNSSQIISKMQEKNSIKCQVIFFIADSPVLWMARIICYDCIRHFPRIGDMLMSLYFFFFFLKHEGKFTMLFVVRTTVHTLNKLFYRTVSFCKLRHYGRWWQECL